MKDKYGRDISYLRISVTDRCNLRCIYCMPENGIEKKEHKDILSNEDIIKIVKVAVSMGMSKIRITGGEPLIRKGIVSLCKEISNIAGVEELAMTTNGILLYGLCDELKDAGVKNLNISLDSLDEDKYRKITRGGELKEVLVGLSKAREQGFNVKINTVIMKDVNDNEIEDFINFAKKYKLEIRFIELMPLGESDKFYPEAYVSSQDIIKKHPELIFQGQNGGVAERYKFKEDDGAVGFIRPISKNFCDKCNRLRVTADGKIKPCLHSNDEVDLKPFENIAQIEENIEHNKERCLDTYLTEEQIEAAFLEAVHMKPKNMKDSKAQVNKMQSRNMNQIGG